MATTLDLGALRGLTRLRILESGVPILQPEALLDLPALQQVSLFDDTAYAQVTTPGHPLRALMERIKAEGGTVHVGWVSWVGENPPPAYR
jgi:hypothetical protein